MNEKEIELKPVSIEELKMKLGIIKLEKEINRFNFMLLVVLLGMVFLFYEGI